MGFTRALVSGLVGAGALTLIHEVTRRNVADAPRMDVLGMRALARSMRGVGVEPPARDDLFAITLAGDVATNSAYYSLVASGDEEGVWVRALALGLIAGVGAVKLPGALGLGDDTANRTPEQAAMTVALYVVGGLAAATAYSVLGRFSPDSSAT